MRFWAREACEESLSRTLSRHRRTSGSGAWMWLKLVHYIEHQSGGAVCGPFSTSPLSAQPEYHYRHVGPFGWAVCTPVSKYIFWGLWWPLTLGPPAEMNSRFPPHVLVEDCSKNLVAEVLGLAWLSLKGVCVLCFSALSVCKDWGHVVAPLLERTVFFKRCSGFCRAHTFSFPGFQK